MGAMTMSNDQICDRKDAPPDAPSAPTRARALISTTLRQDQQHAHPQAQETGRQYGAVLAAHRTGSGKTHQTPDCGLSQGRPRGPGSASTASRSTGTPASASTTARLSRA